MSLRPVVTGFLLCLSLCFDLGVVNLGVLRAALQQGGAAGAWIGVGACIGDMVYFLLAAFGATALLRWAPFRWGLWSFGTVALAVLAWRMIRETIHPRKLDLAGGTVSRQSTPALLALGAGLALASPTSILWFAAVGGSVIASFGGDRRVLLPFAIGFFGAGIGWAFAFAYGAAALRRILGDQFVRALSAISAALFLYFAVMVFLSGLAKTN
jgi:L-lysine exporter family protein LysE/ArgO